MRCFRQRSAYRRGLWGWGDGTYVVDTYPSEIHVGVNPDDNVINVLYVPDSANLPDDIEIPSDTTQPGDGAPPGDGAQPGEPFALLQAGLVDILHVVGVGLAHGVLDHFVGDFRLVLSVARFDEGSVRVSGYSPFEVRCQPLQ